MLMIKPSKIYICSANADMKKSIDELASIVEQKFVLTFMGYNSYQEIEYTPPVIKIIEHRKKKYVCKSCEIIRTAKAPLPLFDRSLVSPSLLSHIINEKFCKGVPLYRLEQDLHRMGINISRQSMCSWIISGAELLKPIYDIMHQLCAWTKRIFDECIC